MKYLFVIITFFSLVSISFADKVYMDPSKRMKKGLLEEEPVQVEKVLIAKKDVPNKKRTKQERRVEKVCSCHMLKMMSSYASRICESAKKKGRTEDSCGSLYVKGYGDSYYDKARKASALLSDKYDVDIEEECEEYEDQIPREKKYRKLRKIIKNWHSDKCNTDMILSL